MYEEEDFDDAKRRYELNKKFNNHRDQDKRIKNPVSKGSRRSQSKKLLRRYIDVYTSGKHIDEDDFDDSDFDESDFE